MILRNFIKNAYKSREIKVNLKRNLEVKALQEFIKLFKSSQFISCKSIYCVIMQIDDLGRSHYLLRKWKQRKHSEIEDDEKEKLKQTIENF